MSTSKTCPECRTEYLVRADRCADCGVALVWTGEHIPTERLDPEAWEDFGPDEILGQLTGDLQDVIEVYMSSLKAAGLRCAALPRTRYQGKSTALRYSPVFGNALVGGKPAQVPQSVMDEGFLFDLFVTRDDYAAAERIVEELYPELHPDQPEGLNLEFDLGSCPACGASLAEDASACPDCGLALA